MENIIIFGASGHAKVIIDIIESQKKYNIVGIIDDFKSSRETLLGYSILGKTKDLEEITRAHGTSKGIIAIGDNWVRNNIYHKIISILPEFEFATLIHKNAVISKHSEIGQGSVVMAGTTVNPGSQIGQHCILNTNSSLDHDCKMNSFSSLAPGVTTGGNVTVGEFSAISLGAKIIHGKSVGEHTVVGAGSVVLNDIPSLSVAYGCPAKTVRSRKKGEKYLY